MTSDTAPDPFQGLSETVCVAWAKSDMDPVTQEVKGWLPVYQHLADTAAIAGLLWDRWLSPSVKRLIAKDVGSAEHARSLAVWLAGTHDLGKISPAFAVQVRALAHPMQSQGLNIARSIEGTEERRVARHEIVSHLAVTAWLRDVHGYGMPTADKLGSVLAAHHGRPPGPSAVRQTASDARLHGDGLWAHARVELLEAITAELDIDPAWWRESTITQPTLALLSAFVIVADWIASSDHFPLAAPGTQPTESAAVRATRAWRELAMPPPWTAHAPADDRELFRTRFGIDAEPRPIQREMMRLAREIDAPTLIILEADTGIGKTEAALAAAEILCERFDRSGIFLGLPTQATADGMFTRILSWAERLELNEPLNVFLAHGKARLNEQNARLLRTAFGSVAMDDASEDHLVTAHTWFADSKRGPLSSLVIGTIDQALFGALRTRHVALRHLALAGKVVILDEVHAYDTFMNQYMERILHWLGAYDVPVIMLSATLPAERRKSFVKAYESGRPRPIVRRGRAARRAAAEAGATGPAPTDVLAGDIGYPSIVVSRAHADPLIVHPADTGRERRIVLDRVEDDPASLRALLADALVDGGCAVVIRNTVRRVQETAADLREQFGGDAVTVAHSRFLGLDRAARDRRLLDLFGPRGARPGLHIVVASQVVEQSLDIDFDIMISDIAPIDLLLQRVGRLHRHPRTGRPPLLREPRLVLTGAEWSEEPPRTYRDNERVYDRSILLRTLAVLADRRSLDLPRDTPSLVQEVYEEPATPLHWSSPEEDARLRSEDRKAKARAKATTYRLDTVNTADSANLLNWIKDDAGDPDRDPSARGAVRDTEETLEVLVLQEDEEGVLRTPSWLRRHGGAAVPTESLPAPWLSDVILGCSLRLPLALCRGEHIDQHIRTLEHRYPAPAWHGSHALRGELILVLDVDGRVTLEPFDLLYTREDGLSFSRSSSESELPL
ncbi:CRISPR-associated helicase Cas3/CRISPR-associated endonuclease Cas3-HD [Microbacterium resistens]|uniref:CRISPR-associated helicase Cas3/CRISPR-associated endonuclease Cas3-HD n=1 Tax=Microbacterium resistens TaxID=156977 RepID=A0ABU1SBZ1_9MICO|nr:CRISPR-associated helicase Cas3' [Microbacterium resistens]MDR6867122.1 CRISPR-associated helicase Cas3/CRISPR-associated endonuclease Cas3-HD [Microbacterium resistens]